MHTGLTYIWLFINTGEGVSREPAWGPQGMTGGPPLRELGQPATAPLLTWAQGRPPREAPTSAQTALLH